MLATTWEDSSRVLGRSTVLILFALLFLIAISAVFFGFIGYYSRVSLSNELRQNKDGTSVDLLFMSVDQITKDESALVVLRQQKNFLEANGNHRLDDIREKAYASPEFADYFNAKAKLVSLFNANRSRFTDDYWNKVSAPLFKNSADDFEKDIALWTAPSFREGVTDDEKSHFYENLTPLIDAISRPYRDYNAKYQQTLYQQELASQREREPIIDEIMAIFARNPHLATAADRKTFLDIEPTSPEIRQRLAQQRAIIRSFDNLFVGRMRKILEWPTIASTLLVTLATGWLGGLVNFMGAAMRAHAKRDELDVAMPGIGNLFRRSFLGITAALGIFLAAGSGLLILTAQNAGAPGTGAIELSPYFVAFLAFISGFLADDAFARLASAGRKLFQVKEEDPEPQKEGEGADQPEANVNQPSGPLGGEEASVVREARPVLATSYVQP
jgi:hypothetical protein